ncbi:2161_t:CDS:2 [Diversispora eburnea]|uniref:2161_t:CDS:1 n=1 Tax=Diversispora eburnea TaxID=1213867 RepID=A0A9N8VAC2_9GLOM|nr:2161_t:CDS:2 [Diversispora eburnea]
MKFQSIYASILILAFNHFLIAFAAHPCIDYPDPLNPGRFEFTDCPNIVEDDIEDLPNVKREIQNFFHIDINCYSDATLCKKIKKAFDDAGKEISKVLKLKKKIYVNATFESFSLMERNVLGSTYPTRSIFLTSDDKITRLYPQALAKQFSLNVHPAYSKYDINSRFNADFGWWFKSDNKTIETDQYDFSIVVLHELIHGLGFISSWDNSLETNVYQYVTGLTSIYYFYDNKYGGFVENIFDRYLKLIENKKKIPLSDYTAQLDKSVPPMTPFNTILQFTNRVKSSPKWKYAKLVLKAATTNNSIIFTPAKRTSWNQDIYLETSLKPFNAGSSISHVSQLKYRKTSDFLMTYQQFPGQTLEYFIKRGGNYKSPIGPRIISILESIGYATDTHPNPVKPTLPSKKYPTM